MTATRAKDAEPVYLVDASRTPVLSWREPPGAFSAADLALAAGRPLLTRQALVPELLDAVLLGTQAADQGDVAAQLRRRLGCGARTLAVSFSGDEHAGIQALEAAAQRIGCGEADLLLVGACDAMSRATVFLDGALEDYVLAWRSRRSLPERLRLALAFRPSLLRALIRPTTRRGDVGEAGERLASLFDFTREQLEVHARTSVERAARGGGLGAPEPLFAGDGSLHVDDCARAGRATPAAPSGGYDRLSPTLIAPPADAAAWLLLASATALERHSLEPVAVLRGLCWSAPEAAEAELGPARAVVQLLERMSIPLDAVGAWEIDEPTAAHALGFLEALADSAHCRRWLGRSEPCGRIDLARVNAAGGALAVGAPGAAGAVRQIMQLLAALRLKDARLGLAAGGTGQGWAVSLEKAA